MIKQVFSIFLALGLVFDLSSAQWFGPGLPGIGRGGLPSQSGNSMPSIQTCSARDNTGNEMKVTFSVEEGNSQPRLSNPWGSMFRRFSGPSSLHLSATISTPMDWRFQSQYKLVVTEFSRVEDGCSSDALGSILADRNFLGQTVNTKGIFRDIVNMGLSRSITYKDVVTGLTPGELTGRGLALCPADSINGNKCQGFIPLCCKIGIDSQAADRPFVFMNQMIGQTSVNQRQNINGGSFNPATLNQGFNNGAGTFGQNSLPSSLGGFAI